MSNQSLKQASVRTVTGTSLTYEGDWHALFDLLGLPSGDYNGRLLQYINVKLGTTYTNLPSAMMAFALANGASNWDGLGSFDASIIQLPPVTSGLIGFYDSDATNGHTFVGDDVTQWTDLSGSANHITVSGAVKTGVATINGLNAFDLDGTCFFILPAGILALTNSTNYSLYAVIKPDGKTNEKIWWFHNASLDNGRAEYDFGGDVARFQNGSGQSNISITHTTSQNIFSAIKTGAGLVGRYNATAGSSVTASTFASTAGALGAEYNGSTSTARLNGKYCSFLAYNRNVNGTEDTDIRAWLKTRWGTP